MKHTIAAIQMTTTPDLEINYLKAAALITEAANRGATLIGIPEYWAAMPDRSTIPEVMPIATGTFMRLRALCASLQITLIAGTVFTPGADGKPSNTTLVIDPQGNIAASYSKIHLFDIDIPGSAVYQESTIMSPGSTPTVVDTPIAPVGLAICYDLRFPELFRHLTLHLGARIIFIPAAFALHTGKDHWLPLLKARAIENQVFIAAPAQYGHACDGNTYYGRSLIIDPWGNTLASAPDCECSIFATIDLSMQDSIRAQLPALAHARPELFASPGKPR